MIKLKYQNTGSSAVTLTFKELALYELPEAERIGLTTLRGNRVSHIAHWRRVWNVYLTTEASNDILTIGDFWIAEMQWLQQPYSALDVNWIRVVTDGGRCPISFAQGIVYFPEVGLELFEKAAC